METLIIIAVIGWFGWVFLLLYWLNNRTGGFDIDETLWFKVRDKILKDRYAGCQYSMFSSFSPVIVRHRNPLPLKDRHTIQKLFPKWIRIEFQEVDYDGEVTSIYGRGNLIDGELRDLLYLFLKKNCGELPVDSDLEEVHTYKKTENGWEREGGERKPFKGGVS